MKSISCAVALSALSALAPARADAAITSKVIYSYRDWEVRLVNYDNRNLRCQARVSRNGYSFSLYASPGSGVRMQFYSTGWAFGDPHRGNLKLRIGGYPSWRLSNAELYKHSVLFNLPGGSKGSKFLMEVSNGSTLTLYNDRGSHVHTYSLSGSRASMDALIKCVRALRQGGSRSSNPFD
ncbi:hypothetical protein [Acidimangrovimonas sediminis]|uniref:hypothetical protein n=1 Tax=Acidimangrovimonas sediminis TaxID=2056283 RepID=UPI0011AF6503|nr:hypothetical protein [Acidimangrovimonas sediminis]